MNPKNNLNFIHVGKCGGTTVRNTLIEKGITHKCTHVSRAIYNPDMKYLIVLRNPVERFISAFYWRKRLSLNEQKGRFIGEYEFFKKYPTIEDMIPCGIEEIQQQQGIHLKHDFDFYLGNFVDQCKPDDIVGIICTESLKKDFKNIFGFEPTRHARNNRDRKQPINEASRKFLKKYLHKDYLVIEKLKNLKALSQDQYEILLR